MRSKFQPIAKTEWGERRQQLHSALHLFEEPVSLNVAETLPALAAAGVRVIKIGGHERGRAYVTTAVHRSIVANDWLSAQQRPMSIDVPTREAVV